MSQAHSHNPDIALILNSSDKLRPWTCPSSSARIIPANPIFAGCWRRFECKRCRRSGGNCCWWTMRRSSPSRRNGICRGIRILATSTSQKAGPHQRACPRLERIVRPDAGLWSTTTTYWQRIISPRLSAFSSSGRCWERVGAGICKGEFEVPPPESIQPYLAGPRGA